MYASNGLIKNKGFIEKNLRKVNVGNRFFLIFISLSLIPMILLAIITYNKSETAIENKVSAYCIQVNNGIRTNFDLLFKKIDEFTIEVIYKNQFQSKIRQLIDNNNVPNQNKFFLINDIQNYLKENIILNRKAIIKTSILTRNNDRVSYDIDHNNYLRALTPDIISEELYEHAVKSKGKLVWNTVAEEDMSNLYGYKDMDNAFQVTRAFTLVKRSGTIQGVFSILYSSSYLQSVYDEFSGAGDVYLIDDNNTILFSNKKELLFKKFPYSKEIDLKTNNSNDTNDVYVSKVAEENLMLAYSKSKINGWRVVFATPYSPLIQETKDFKVFLTIASIILLCISALVAYVFSASISNPLKRLIKVTSMVELGRFDVKDEVTGKDEIADLSIAFNEMIGKVDELIKEVYETKIREKDFKLKALQSQINPHFLYNTLEGIRWAARRNKDFEVSKRVENLSSLFRLILSDNNVITTIEQEVKYTEYYLFFQKQSYKEKLNVIWDIDESVRNYKAIKLLLQPIVENSILHGMDPTKGTLTITIKIKDIGKDIFISVEDDGSGTNQEKVKKSIDSTEKNSDSIGIKNVNYRVKEYYGENYGLKFYSEIGQGTTVEIIIPKKV